MKNMEKSEGKMEKVETTANEMTAEPAAAASGKSAGKKKGLFNKEKKPAIPGKKSHKLRTALIVVAVLVVGFFVVSRFLGNKAPVGDASYLAEPVQRQDLTVKVTGSATLEPADSYKVTTLLSGEIQSAPFEEGDLVSKDDVLYQMDSSTAQDTAASAAIGIQESKLTYQAAKEAMYPTATQSGTINQIYVKNGDSVTAGQELVKIVASNEIDVDFMFDAVPAAQFYIGQSVNIYISQFAGALTGTITSMSNSSMTASTGFTLRTVHVRATNPGLVTDDYTATASIAGISSYGTSPVSLSGTTTVYATGSGTVTNMKAMAGGTVAKGDVICTLDSESNRVAIKNAQLSMERSQISQGTANKNITDYSIKSPISGTVIEKTIKTGDMVKGMDTGTLAVIYDLSYLKLVMNVDELDIGKVAVGQDVEIMAGALGDQVFHGTVDKISINGSTTSGVTTYPVTIIIKDYGNLLPGMNASVSILGDTVKNALCIPVDAVNTGDTVLVAGAGAMNADNTLVVDPSKIETRTVTLGKNDEDYIEVTDGLEEGDIVLIQNQASDAMAAMMG
jgi:HlyD family secretion protein